MSKVTQIVLGAAIVAILFAVVGAAVAEPPSDQTYTGSKRCASCHFKAFMSWKKTGHAKAFEDLPTKYKTDETCLKCHTTGFGTPTGYKDATTASLAGNTCETCHGPGSAHETSAEKYAKVKELTPAQEEEVRGTIWKLVPGNVCVTCHQTKAHVAHEKYDE